jgi:hypothetical protein
MSEREPNPIKPKKFNTLRGRYANFVHIYIATGNRARAYKQAGFTAQTDKQAQQRAYSLLKRPDVAAYLKEVQQHVKDHEAAQMAIEYKRTRKIRQQIAYQDPADLFDENGKSKPIHEIPREARRMIAGITITKDGEVTYKLRDPHPHLSAIEDKYAIMPDNQRPAQKIDLTSGGLSLAEVDTHKAGLLALLADIKSRVAIPLPEAEIVRPTLNGVAHGLSTNGSNGHV